VAAVRLPKLRQEVACELPGYEGVTVGVWVNAPQGIIDTWAQMREDAFNKDERGRPLPLLDEAGEVVIDPDTFEPLKSVDEGKLFEASKFFLQSLLMDFSITEDYDGNPLSPQDDDFVKRLPEDLIQWLYAAVTAAVQERRNAGKASVRLAEITGR
jgi:hypothetical protein